MSRGQFKMRTRSARTALRKCNNKRNNNRTTVDVDRGKIDVIIVDTPESSNRKTRCSKNTNNKHFSTVIFIEEDDDDDDIGFRRSDHYATSGKTFHPSSSNSYTVEDFDSDECQMLNRKGKSCSKYPKQIFGTVSSECNASAVDTSERNISENEIWDTKYYESDSSDCEIMDGSSVNIREEWEKAALKKKIEKKDADSKEGVGASGFHNASGVSPCKTSEDVNMNGASCDTYTVQNKDEVHSNVNSPVNRIDDLLSAPDILNGFTEQHSFNLKRKNSVEVSEHTVAEGSNERSGSKRKNEPLSGKTSPHRCHSQSEVSSDHKVMANSCCQDTLFQSHFSHDTWMQQGFHCQVDGASSMDDEDKEKASSFTAELPDEPQCEDMQRYENLSPCNIPCSSLNVPHPQTRKVTVVAQDTSSFQPHSACASSEPTDCLNEQHADMLDTHHSFGGEKAVSQGRMRNFVQGDVNFMMIPQSNVENMDTVSNVENDIIGERERLKESEEYRRAEEEEWASRQRQLQIQSEEAQRLRKRKKAETLRLLDMERRQKERLEEIRESQKRDKETINLKEQIRVQIQKELEKLEVKYKDMASLLRGLGISVGGGPYPLAHEVNAAYKQALLRFHPDRASRGNIQQQVEAEEKFKLISRLKEKLLPVA